MAIWGGLVGPKSENVEKSYVFVCFLEAQRGEEWFGEEGAEFGWEDSEMDRYSDMYRGEDKGGVHDPSERKNNNKQLLEENNIKCGTNPQA